MVETDLNPVKEDEVVVTGLAVLNTGELVTASKKDKNNFKETLTSLLEIPVDRDKMAEMLQNENVPDKPTMGDYLAGAMIMKAAMGDTKAYEVIRDTMGQKPVERIEQDTIVQVRMPSEYKEYGE